MHIATRIAVFLLILNSSATALNASGVADSWGVDPNPGQDSTIKELNNAMDNIMAAQGPADTLGALHTGVTKSVKGLFHFVLAGPAMFGNLGVPGWLTALVFAPQYAIVGSAIVYSIIGRRI